MKSDLIQEWTARHAESRKQKSKQLGRNLQFVVSNFENNLKSRGRENGTQKGVHILQLEQLKSKYLH